MYILLKNQRWFIVFAYTVKNFGGYKQNDLICKENYKKSPGHATLKKKFTCRYRNSFVCRKRIFSIAASGIPPMANRFFFRPKRLKKIGNVKKIKKKISVYLRYFLPIFLTFQVICNYLSKKKKLH